VTDRQKILVADDDPIVLELMERALMAAGFEVFSAASGAQAVEVATTNAVDLALLDYRMPDFSGLEAGRSIHKLTGARFIVVSVHTDQATIEQAAAEGALGFIVKPINFSELIAQVRVGLERASEFALLKNAMNSLEQKASEAITRAVTSARSVNTAVGILMERQHLPRNEAYNLLVRHARDSQRKLLDLSEEIVRSREIDYIRSKS
jgi:DNA-binding response OmpR family regulator